MPSIWIAFILILWEGLLGGGCYVNAFNQVIIDLPKKDHEWTIAFVSIADSIGISLAGFLGNFNVFKNGKRVFCVFNLFNSFFKMIENNVKYSIGDVMRKLRSIDLTRQT